MQQAAYGFLSGQTVIEYPRRNIGYSIFNIRYSSVPMFLDGVGDLSSHQEQQRRQIDPQHEQQHCDAIRVRDDLVDGGELHQIYAKPDLGDFKDDRNHEGHEERGLPFEPCRGREEVHGKKEHGTKTDSQEMGRETLETGEPERRHGNEGVGGEQCGCQDDEDDIEGEIVDKPPRCFHAPNVVESDACRRE